MMIGIICFIGGFATACTVIALCNATGKDEDLND